MIFLAAFGYGIVVTLISALLLHWRQPQDWQPLGAVIAGAVLANNAHADIWLLMGCIIAAFVGFAATAVSYFLLVKRGGAE